jgi:hypothetical protein
MRWFKHLTDTWEDEKIAKLLKSGRGADGRFTLYGLWWRILEIVARKMGKDSRECSATFPTGMWANLLGIWPPNVYRQLSKLAAVGLIILEPAPYPLKASKGTASKRHAESRLATSKRHAESRLATSKRHAESRLATSCITVKVPNLLKYRDEWSKRTSSDSGVTPSQNQKQNQKQSESAESSKSEAKARKRADDFTHTQEGPEELPPMTREEEKQNAERVFDQLRETEQGRELAEGFLGARNPAIGDSTNGPEKPKSQEHARGEGRAVKLSPADYREGETFGINRAALEKLGAQFPDCDFSVEIPRIEGRLSDDDTSRPKNPVAYLRACLSKGGYAVRRLESPTGKMRWFDDLTPEELEQRSRLPAAQREVLIGYPGMKAIVEDFKKRDAERRPA